MASLESLKYIKTINKTLGKNSDKDVLLNDLVEDYNKGSENSIYRFHVIVNSIDGKEVYINDSVTPIRGVVDIKKKQGASSEEEYVLQTLPNQMRTGDIVRFKMNDTDILRDYLITSGIEKKNGYDEAVFLECNQTLNLKGWSNPIPCWGTNTSYGVKGKIENNYFALTDGKIQFKIQKNKFTDMIDKGIRFIFNNSKKLVYEVVEVENVLNSNIYTITVEKDEYDSANDDLKNNIAYNPSLEVEEPDNPNPPPSYSYNVVADNGDLSLKKYNANTFRIIDNYGNPVSTVWEITINYNGIPEDAIQKKEVGSNYIKLLNTKGYFENPLIINFKRNQNLLTAKIRMVN